MSSSNNSVKRQVALLRAQVFSAVNEANSSISPERQVTYKSALTVIKRSLDASRNKPFEVREFHAMRELSAFITLSQKNKSLSQIPRNTDLLPVGHPASTTNHAMTASAFVNAQIQWALADSRISDEARPLLASLYTSEPESPEYKYALIRLGALPPGSAPLEALVASFGDGNSFAARRARAMLQRRDRKGRFAYQGGGIKALIKRLSGVVENLTGKTVSSSSDGNTVRVELPDGRLVDVPVDSGEFIKAIINPTPDGFSGIPAQYSAGDTIADEASLQFFDAPHGFTKDDSYSGDGVMYTDDSYDIIKRSDGTFDVSQRGAKGLGTADSWSESMKLIQSDEPNLIKAEGSKGEQIARLTPQQIDDMYDPEKNPFDVNPGGEGSKNKESAQKQLDDLNNSEILRITKNDDGSLRYENDLGDSNFALELRATDDGKISVIRTEYTREQDGYEEAGERDLGNYDSIEAILEDDLFEDGGDLPQQYDDWKAQQAPEAAPEPVAELPEAAPEPSKKVEEFTKFEVPEGAIKLPLDPAGYDPEGRIDEESTDFTDDPAVLANKYDTKDLIDTLEAAIVPQDGAKNATGYGPLEFNQGEEFVPAEAIYAALDQQGEDAQMIAAKIYDNQNGDTKNQDALKASREVKAPAKKIAEISTPAQAGDPNKPVGEPGSWKYEPRPSYGGDNYPGEKNNPTETRGTVSQLREGDYVWSDGEWKKVVKREVKKLKDPKVNVNKPGDASKYNTITLHTITLEDGTQLDQSSGQHGGLERFTYVPFNDPTKPVDNRDGTFTWRGVTFRKNFGKYSAVGYHAGLGIGTSDTPEGLAKNIDAYLDKSGSKGGGTPGGRSPRPSPDGGGRWVPDGGGLPSPDGDGTPDGTPGAEFPQEEVIEEEVFGSIGEILKAWIDDVINIWNGKYKSGPSRSRIRDFAEQTGIPEADIIKAVEDAGVEIAPNPESEVSADPTPEPDVAQEVLYEDAPPIEAVTPEPTNEPDVADIVDEVKGGIPTSSEIKAMLDGEEIGSQDDISGDAPSEVLPKALQEEKAVDSPAGTTAPGQLQEIPYETSKFVPNDPDNPDGPGRVEKSTGKAQVIDIAGRKVVIVDVNGTPVPFYLSTGAGGKEDVPAGKWYPFFGVGEDGWINKGNAEDINNYYGSPELRAQAELLDATIGDIRANDSIPKVTPAGPHIDAINADLTPTENNKPDSVDNLQSNVDALVEKVKTEATPEATPEAVTSDIRFLDPEGDLQDQVAKAIEDGKQVRFFYNGSERIVTPVEVKYNEKNGNYNLVTEDAQGNVKTYTLSKIEGAPDKNTTPEPVALPEPVGAPQRVTTAVKDLQPGDVLANDYFVVESVFSDADAEAAKPGAVWVTGYYPGHASQKTKLWYPEDSREVFRFVEPPAKGDLPELSKPFAKNFGRVYKDQNGEWKLRSPEAQAEYDAAKAEYDKKLAEAMGRWTAPENAPTLDAVVQVPNAPYKLVQNAQDLLPGDIAYQQEDPKFAAGLLPEPYTHYFVIQEVFTDENTPEGKVNVRGYYPGHEPQVREWNKETPISIIRGDQAPAVGDKPALISPKQKDDKYEKDQNGRITPAGREAWLQDKAAFIEATKASAQNYNDVVVDYIAPDQALAPENAIPQSPRKPFKTVPAFQGDRLIEIVKAANGDPAKLKELLSQEEIIFFDYESTGDGNFKENADVIQLAAHRVKNGEIIDTFDVFINPGAPLGDWYYTTDENGNKVLKGSLKTADGQVVDDAFLANQISADEAHRQFAEWLGQDYILAGQNAGIFDAPILKYRLEQAGAEYNPAGLIDTLPLARSVTGQKKGNGLEALAARYGINLENAHNANDDAKATSELLSALLDDMAQNKKGLDQLDPDAVADKAAQEMAAYEAAKKAYEDFQAGIVQAAVVDGGVNKDGSPITADQLIKEANANNVVDPEAFKAIPDGVKTEVPSLDSASWVNDDENTTLINETLRPTDLQLGDYIPTLDGGYRQIVDITEDPDNKDNFLVATRLVGTDEVIIASWFKYNKGFNGVRRPNDAPENPTPAAQASPVDQIVSDILDGKTTDVPSIDELIKTATPTPEADGGGGSDSSGDGGVVPAAPTTPPSEGGGPEATPTPESDQVNNNVAANKRWQARFGRKPPVFYKKNRGMFYDINQVPVNVGDKVTHNNPDFAAKYGEGVVVARIPNLQRKRVIGGRWVPVDYASYVYVTFGDGKPPRKFAARMLVNSDQDAVENPANEVKPVPDAEMGVPDVYIDNWKKFGKALEEFGVVPGKNLFGNDGFQAEAGNAQQVVITKDKDGNYAVYLKEENVRGYNRKVEPLFVSSNLPEAANFFVAEVHNRRYGVDLPPNPVWEGLEAPADPKTGVVDVSDAPAIDNSGKPSVVNIDPADDVQQQLQDAIDNGQKVAFFYNDKERLLDPINIWYNPKRDHFNLYAADPEGIKKNYTLDLIQKLDKPVEAPPIPEPLPLDKFEDFDNYVEVLVANPDYKNDYDIVKFGGDGVVFIQDKENKNQANIIWDEEAQGYKVSFNRSDLAEDVVFADIEEAGQYAIDNLEKERNKATPEAPPLPEAPVVEEDTSGFDSSKVNALKKAAQDFQNNYENVESDYQLRATFDTAYLEDMQIGNRVKLSWDENAEGWKVEYELFDESSKDPKYFADLQEAINEAQSDLRDLRGPANDSPGVEPKNEVPEAPATPSADTVQIDPAGNAEQQIMDAIESGKKIVFNYNGSERVLTPLSVRKNPNNGNVNVYAEDADGERKNYTISKMEKVEKPAEQAPAATPAAEVPSTPSEDIVIPEAPTPNNISLKEAKARAAVVAQKIDEKPVSENLTHLSEVQIGRLKAYIKDGLIKPGRDQRRDKGFNEALDYSIKYAMNLGFFEEAQQLLAIRARQDGLGLRPMDTEFAKNIENLRNSYPNFASVLQNARREIRYNPNDIKDLQQAYMDIAVYSDPYNRKYRLAVESALESIDNLVSRDDLSQETKLGLSEMRDFISQSFGDLPPVPKVKKFKADSGKLDGPAAELAGYTYDQLTQGVGDWKYSKTIADEGNLNGGLLVLINKKTGQEVVIKRDRDRAHEYDGKFKALGVGAEEMVAQLYRDLGFASPEFKVLNPEEKNEELRALGVMEFVDNGFFNLVDFKVAGKQRKFGYLSNVDPQYRAELLDFLVANGIIGNTDRHGGNIMVGVDPITGKQRIVPIDNGLALFNARFGTAEKQSQDPVYLRPDKVIAGNYGNYNAAVGVAAQYAQSIGRDAAKDQIKEFAERMKARAEVLQFIDDRAGDYMSARAQWILDNLDKYLDSIMSTGNVSF